MWLFQTTHIEIQFTLSKVGGEFTVDSTTVSRWANRFRAGYVSIDNDSRRSRTSPDERSGKPAADVLEEDRRATCEELYGAAGANTSQGNAQEPITDARGWTTHSL